MLVTFCFLSGKITINYLFSRCSTFSSSLLTIYSFLLLNVYTVVKTVKWYTGATVCSFSCNVLLPLTYLCNACACIVHHCDGRMQSKDHGARFALSNLRVLRCIYTRKFIKANKVCEEKHFASISRCIDAFIDTPPKLNSRTTDHLQFTTTVLLL